MNLFGSKWRRYLTDFPLSRYITQGCIIVGSYAQIKTHTKNAWSRQHSPIEAPQAPSYKLNPAKSV